MSLLKKLLMGLKDFMRSSFHSENLPVTIGNKIVTGLKPPAAAAGAGSEGMGIDVAPGLGLPMRFEGSISKLNRSVDSKSATIPRS